jgi:outer membrane protein TolC
MCVALIVTASGVSAEVLTLDQCIDLALTQNASVLSPGLKTGLSQAKQAVWSAWGGLLPSASWSMNYSYNDPPFFDPTTGDIIASRYSTSFRIGQRVFDGLSNIYTVRRAKQDWAASQENYRSAELALILGIKIRYFNLLKNQKLVDVQKDAVARAEEQFKTVESRYELGSASKSEVLKAKVQLGVESLALLDAENKVEVAQADLNRIMNRDVSVPIEVSPDASSAEISIALEEAEAYALSNQPDYLAALYGYEASRSSVRIARALWYPSLDLSASKNYNTFDRGDWFAFNSDDGNWNVGLSVSYPIFSGFQRKTTNATANVRTKAAAEGLEQVRNNVLFAVRQATLAYGLAEQTIVLATETEASAQEDFNLVQEKYNLGAATILDILDAQESLTRAKTDRVNTDFDLALAAAALENAMGQGR